MPCPNQTTKDPSPNRRPFGPPLCLPISPTYRKTRARSCSRHLQLFRDAQQGCGHDAANPKLRGEAGARSETEYGSLLKCSLGAPLEPLRRAKQNGTHDPER